LALVLAYALGIRNIRSQDYSFPGTFVPWTVHSLELWFQVRTLDLSCCGLFVHLSAEQYLIHLQRRNSVTNRCIGLRQRPCSVHSRYTQTVDRRYSASRLNRFSSSERGLLNNTFGILHWELKSPLWVCASFAMRTLPVVSTHCL